MEVNWRGVFTALVTPFNDGGYFDERAMRNLVERQIRAGVAGLVPCGTTGESASMSPAEHQEVVATVVDQAAGRVPIIAGAGSNCLPTALELSHRCVDAGADALLLVTPYYVKPSQRGLVAFYETLADAVPVPIVLYNVPGRTAAGLANATILHLASHPSIVAIKQAVGDLDSLNHLLYQRPEGFAVLSGEDALTLPMIAMGADGVVSVTSNIAPALMTALVNAALAGDRRLGIAIQARLVPLMKAMFLESNPIPVKFALFQLGWIENVLRLPMDRLAPAFHDQVTVALANADLPEESERMESGIAFARLRRSGDEEHDPKASESSLDPLNKTRAPGPTEVSHA